MMNGKVLFLLVPGIVLTGCAGSGTPANSVCGEDLNRATRATITYRTKNKFEVSLDLKTDVKSRSEFQIRLDPKQDSGDAIIETIGRSGELPDKTATSFTWLNSKGTAADYPKNTIILCVPSVPSGTEYKFDVRIGGIGSIDPRVAVE